LEFFGWDDVGKGDLSIKKMNLSLLQVTYHHLSPVKWKNEGNELEIWSQTVPIASDLVCEKEVQVLWQQQAFGLCPVLLE